MTTITVLGAGGFIGSAVVAALSARDIDLRLVARRPLEPPVGAVATVTTHVVDVTEPEALSPVLLGSDVVVHLVKHSGDWRLADTDPATEAVNVDVMRTVVDTFAGRDETPLVVWTGTVGQVGVTPSHPMDGSEPDDPRDGYDQQKLAAERILLDGHAAGAVRGVSLRLATIFGQRRGGPADAGVVVSMARRAMAGEPLTMWGDGSVRRDLLYVDDLVGAILAAIDNPDGLVGRHWVLGSGEEWSLREIFTAVANAVSVHTGRTAVPVTAVAPPPNTSAGDARDVLIDPGPFRRASGWAPRVPPGEGIDRTVAVLVETLAVAERPLEGT